MEDFSLIIEKLEIYKKIDTLGRVLIPQSVRSRFKIAAGDELEVAVIDDWIALRKKGSADAKEVEDAIKLLEEKGYTITKEVYKKQS